MVLKPVERLNSETLAPKTISCLFFWLFPLELQKYIAYSLRCWISIDSLETTPLLLGLRWACCTLQAASKLKGLVGWWD